MLSKSYTCSRVEVPHSCPDFEGRAASRFRPKLHSRAESLSLLLTRKRRYYPSQKSFQNGWKKLICLIYWLMEAKSIFFYFIWRVGELGGGGWFSGKISKLIFFFVLFFLHLTFSSYYCSMDLKTAVLLIVGPQTAFLSNFCQVSQHKFHNKDAKCVFNCL